MTTITKPNVSVPISKKDWEQVEAYYIDIVNQIHIPEDPKPHDITAINAQLERLYHEVRLDFFYASRSFNRIDSAYRKLKRALWPIVKSGKNAEERDHLLQEHLIQMTLDKLDPHMVKNLGLPNAAVTIYVLYESYRERQDFLKTVLDMIGDKSSRLITDSGAMKIEMQLAGH